MKVRWLAWDYIAICGTMNRLIATNMQSEIAPLVDRSSVRFSGTLPEGASYGYTRDVTDQISNFLYDSVPERDFVFARTPAGTSINTSQPRIGLVPPDERHRSQNVFFFFLLCFLGWFFVVCVFVF